jgi:iron complex transport system substrate-binding protein
MSDPMRACSFLPACTQMIYELGLDDRLYGVTFECPSDKPKIVRSHLEGHSYTSAEIDKLVSDAVARDESLYYLDFPLLEAAAPDVIFTQHVCDVCQIGTSFVQRAVHRLKKPAKLVALTPRRLPDVFDNMRTIAEELDARSHAAPPLERANARIDAIVDALRAARARPVRCMVMEWLDPIYNCGHWIPDQIALAGGADVLSAPGSYSVPMDWEKVKLYDPEVLVVAPCGFDVARSRREVARLTERAGFAELSAVRQGRAFVADAQLFTQPSLTQLVTGVELLAHCFHPDVLGAPAGAEGRFAPLA